MQAPDRERQNLDTVRVNVRIENVHRNYATNRGGVPALDGVSLELRAGEAVALIGPSGCGKSTLLNLVSGVDRADSGNVYVCDFDLAHATESEFTKLRRNHVGVVFQAFHLMPNLTAAENVALPLSLAGRMNPDRVNGLLERVGLGHRLNHLPNELSGGEEQRVAIARALVHEPDLVVADEPTGNLDSKSGAEVLRLLDELRREEGTSLFIATHDPRVADFADRVLEMADGKILKETSSR